MTHENNGRWLAAALFGAAMLAAIKVHAEMSAEELAKLAQNPVGNLISLPFQNNTNLNFGPEKGTQNILNIQPVIPIEISKDWNIINFPLNPRYTKQGTLDGKIGDTAFLLRAQQVEQRTPKAFVALVVFWLALLFASFGLFAPRNFTSAVILTLSALAVAGAVGMILELEQGFGRLVHISPQPMYQAVKVVQTELNSVTP